MKKYLRQIFEYINSTIDAFLSIVIVPAAYLLLTFRRIGSGRLPKTSRMLKKIGVYPIRDHYYEPLFNDRHLKEGLNVDRDLPGLNLNEENQLRLLSELNYAKELKSLGLNDRSENKFDFYINNESFKSGDAEFLYQIIRKIKPRKIIEVGSGFSTKIAQLALRKNKEENNIDVIHICVEPYEQPWLKDFPGIKLIRNKIEELDFSWSTELSEGDLLFIDSSHMIRPQGDVLKEYLQIIPKLSYGVYVHIHDIFTPKDYLTNWVTDDVKFWNEQYLLEALLSNTDRYEVVAAINYLKHNHYEKLLEVCPYLTEEREPGSFYFKVGGFKSDVQHPLVFPINPLEPA